MDDSEKLLALKKVYADIILNTAKEAAARVMASERKATRFHQELLSTKDEALQMLLRLKQMLDSKVKEAELASLSQQKKIDVLEAQLQEAEDIVSNLRAELREAETKLENLAKHQMYPPVEQNVEGEIGTTQENCLQDNRIGPYDGSAHTPPDSHAESVSVSDTTNPIVNGTNDSSKFGVLHDHTNNCYIHNPEFSSVDIRRKEPELYRNGCTQRIRASERSLFDGNMSVSGNLDNAHDETSVSVHEEGKAMPVTTNAITDSIFEKEKPDELKVVKADADPVKVPACKRRRNIIKVLRSRLRAKRDMKRNKASHVADAKDSPCVWGNNYSSTVNSSMECENEARKNLVRVCEEDKTTVTTNGEADTICGKEKLDKVEMVKTDGDLVKAFVRKKRRLTMRVHPGQVNTTNEASYLSDAKGSTCVSDNNDLIRVDSYLVCEKGALKDVMTPFTEVPMDETDTTEKSESRECIAKEGLFLNACSARSKIKDDKESFGKSDLIRHESLSTEGLEVSSCRADVKQANESPEKPDPKASDLNKKVSYQPANNKFLKYTFQRKRKKVPITSADVDCSLENDSLKKSGEKQNGCVELQKSCPMTDSSRESRRLAQVARQLISLSEKKWRQ